MIQKYTSRLWLILLLLLSFPAAKAQIVINTPDTLICPGTSATLRSTLTGRIATSVSLSDDYYTGVIPLGFSFTFYGNTYTKCVFGSNGYIRFDTSLASQPSGYQITTGVPGTGTGPGAVLNSIMGYYADIDPFYGGTLDYCTVGTAPNRKFVLSFCDAAMFSCTTLKCSFQVILYETSNLIEVHLGSSALCTGWNGGYAIEGVQNSAGTDAVTVPGRNYPNQWNAFHSAHSFTPTVTSGGAATYTVAPITYNPVPNGNVPVNWYTLAGVLVGTGTNITVAPNVTTTYIAKVTNCSDTLSDTVTVTVGPSGPGGIGPHVDSANSTDPTYCGATDGSMRIFGLTPNTAHLVYYSKNGIPNTPFTLVSNAQGIITVNNLNAGVYSNIYVKRGICISNSVGPLTLTDPPLIADYTYNIRYGCSADTVSFTNNTTGGGTVYSWEWDYGGNFTDTSMNPTHVFVLQALQSVQLIAHNQVCADTVVKSIDTRHPLVASFTVDHDSACAAQVVNFTNTSVATVINGIQPTFWWDFGDGTTATGGQAQHSFGPGIYHVKMAITDFVPCTDTAYKTIVVDSLPYIDFVTSDSVLCLGQSITFNGSYLAMGNTGIGWSFGDGLVKDNVNPVIHAFDAAKTYAVTFTASYRNCPDTSVTRNIVIKPFPTIDLGPDTSICPNGAPLTLHDINGFNGSLSWLWNTGETTPAIQISQPGSYWATVTANGCTMTDSIRVLRDCYLNMPNSFTPNGDGINDYFFPRQFLSRSVTAFKMTIFNRWGETIFETASIDGRGWDGRFNDKPQPQGAYVYLIDVLFENGVKEHYQGTVTLLR
ncbi:PKD domain-containing protein [Chitinophagaceae bacterium MMS25-I14]